MGTRALLVSARINEHFSRKLTLVGCEWIGAFVFAVFLALPVHESLADSTVQQPTPARKALNKLSRLGQQNSGRQVSPASAQKTEPTFDLPPAPKGAAAAIPQSETPAQRTRSLSRFPSKTEERREQLDDPVAEFIVDLDEPASPVDLPSVLQLAGYNSPEVLIAQQRVLAATARQQFAAAQALPNLNLGTNYDAHTGALQRASGAILQIQRSSLYVGAGANAVAAGSVNMPGLQYNLNLSETYFGYLASRQQSERFRAAAMVSRNQTLQQVTAAYCELVRAQGTRAIAVEMREHAADVAKTTADFARIGQGRPSDAERARTELGRRDADILAADAAIIKASATLGQILNLESSVKLQSSENWVVPRSVVPDPIPLPELIAISLYQRPEVAERRAEVHAAMLELKNAQLLIFSPQFIAGFSAGQFGGGGDVASDRNGSPLFGNFNGRSDIDVILYWSIRNMGLANRAMIKASTARLASVDWERTKVLNDVRAEVADAFARTQMHSAQLDHLHRSVTASQDGFDQDLRRTRAADGHPIEVLDSLRLLARSKQDYLDAISNYNRAQYDLYVAIGQPPADLLVHSAEPTANDSDEQGESK